MDGPKIGPTCNSTILDCDYLSSANTLRWNMEQTVEIRENPQLKNYRGNLSEGDYWLKQRTLKVGHGRNGWKDVEDAWSRDKISGSKTGCGMMDSGAILL